MNNLKTIVFTPRDQPEMIEATALAKAGDSIVLLPEPTNERDLHAVACYHGGAKIGYLLRPACQAVAETFPTAVTVYGEAVIANGRLRDAVKIRINWESKGDA